MNQRDDLSGAFSEWRFVRGLTMELLADLSEADLEYAELPSMGPFWKQFRHMARVQEDYIDAIETSKIAFTTDGKSYSGGADVSLLAGYLKAQDRRLELIEAKVAETGSPDEFVVDWFGQEESLHVHLLRLVAHETLHHGQIIVYMKARQKDFPPGWEAWGL
ncbi:MAG: DinB family protein [Candidatus Obscuribacterales bacterium]